VVSCYVVKGSLKDRSPIFSKRFVLGPALKFFPKKVHSLDFSTFFIKQQSEATSWIPLKTKLPVPKKVLIKNSQTLEIQQPNFNLDGISH